MADGCWDMAVGKNAELCDPSFQCFNCETSLSTLKTRFICRTCQPDDKDPYLCQFCVVVHVRKSHQVTDQNNALVEVCEKDKNVAMFLCKTCDLKMFCNACFKDHSGHDFAECSESNDEMKQLVGRVHESLSCFDAIYKRVAKCADIAKTNETRFSEFCDVYNSDYIQRDLEKMWIEVLNEQAITDYFPANQKSLETMSAHVEQLNNAVNEVGDSQVQLRSMLSSSLMRIVRRHSDGELTNLESKQNKPNLLKVPKVTDRDVEDYRKNLDDKRAILIRQLRLLVNQFVRNFKFSKVEFSEVDLHGLGGEFNPLKLLLECTEVKIARSKFGLLLACRVGDQFSVYRVSNPVIDAQFLTQVPAYKLWLSGVGNHECITFFQGSSAFANGHFFINGMNSLQALQPQVNFAYNQLLVLGSSGDNLIPLHVKDSMGDFNVSCAHFNLSFADKHYAEKPYVEKPYCSEFMFSQQYQWGSLVFIRGDQVFLFCYLTPDYQIIGRKPKPPSKWTTAQLKVPCCESGDKHLGKYGCGFVEDHLRPERLLLGLWCLQCKVLEVWGSEMIYVVGGGDITSKFVRELRVNVPVLDMKQVAFFGKKCFVVSTNNTVQYCDDIYQML